MLAPRSHRRLLESEVHVRLKRSYTADDEEAQNELFRSFQHLTDLDYKIKFNLEEQVSSLSHQVYS
ncbi:hypothetical protein J6590_068598 [Homalodisca vitripennis]|nr:hypothetical protein J6590_068598 [Homalodisca vitripennis]